MRKVLTLKIIEHFDSQTKFARYSGIHYSVISFIIHKLRDPTEKQKIIMESMLRTPITELLK